MRAAFLLTLGCLTSIVTVARPVSYTGGWTVIGESDRQSSAVLVHYTPAHQWSVGPRVELNRDDDFALYSVQPTWLAKRWFGADYQGNLYFFGGAGIASGTNGNLLDARFAAYGGVMADWETIPDPKLDRLRIERHRIETRRSLSHAQIVDLP